MGAPGETLDEALETIRLNRELMPHYAWCGLLQPFPGTAIRDQAKNQGLLHDDSDIDRLPASFFAVSVLDSRERDAMESLQRLFDILVQVPVPLRLVRRLLGLPPTRIHDALFKLSYARYVSRIERVTPLDVLRTGLSSHRHFVTRNRGE